VLAERRPAVRLAALRAGNDPNRKTPASHILRRLLTGNPQAMLFGKYIEELHMTAAAVIPVTPQGRCVG
jgi:hypothetical protein